MTKKETKKRLAWLARRPGLASHYKKRWQYGKDVAIWCEAIHACQSCGDHVEGRRKCIDHVHGLHKTDPMFFRGVLCQDCNIALGHLRDDPVRIKKLLAYLLRHLGKK